MTDLRTAAQQALDYWEQVAWGDAVMADKMDALRAALAQQAEPHRDLRAALQAPGCERLREWVEIGPVQRAALETFAAALAQKAKPVEPVAWSHNLIDNIITHRPADIDRRPDRWTPLCKCADTPPQRKPLTEEEIDRATAQARDALLDHIYEYGTAAEGVLERIRKLCRAVERAVERAHGIGGQE